MTRKRQDWRLFVILAILGGLLLSYCGVSLIASDVIGPGICMFLVGIALIIGSVIIFKTFFNTNLGKKDTSIVVKYQLSFRDEICELEDLATLQNKLNQLEPGEEIVVTLTPEYFGLVSWKFFMLKDKYLSFVTLRKKDKLQQFFTMPRPYVVDATMEFADVFEKHNAVNTSNLIDMKRYQSVLDFYNLK